MASYVGMGICGINPACTSFREVFVKGCPGIIQYKTGLNVCPEDQGSVPGPCPALVGGHFGLTWSPVLFHKET